MRDTISFTLEFGELIIEENPMWFLTRQHQLLNILEGMPNKLSMLNLNNYNAQAIYFMDQLDDSELLNLISRVEPRRVNFQIKEIVEHLHQVGRISDEQLFKASNLWIKVKKLPYTEMRTKVRELNTICVAAFNKHTAINKG
jgi:hypothetical protein